ncbi:MAG: metal-dependent hydrolase [Sideroxyarcus sp.]|nr:metal-dependent hydrolase [Sideroxyarcus sp.]
MDIVHHAFIGGVGFMGLAAQEQELTGLGFLVGSVFPDLDVLFIAAGKRFYLKHHQGPTHSLPLAPFYAAAFASIPALQMGWSWALFLSIFAGLAIHVLLDLFNTFGIRLFWPLTKRRHCLDAVFFIDTVTLVLTATFFAIVTAKLVSPGIAVIGYAALFVMYFLGKLALQRHVRALMSVDFAIPSAWNPFGFFLFTRRDGRLETSTYNALSNRVSAIQVTPGTSPDVVELARRSPVFCDMESILRGLSITRVEKNNDGISIVAQDLAVRNFGGKFGRTEVRFDRDGRLIHEMANI